MRIQINVTKEVLERSKMCGLVKDKLNHNTSCGIATAICDLFPRAYISHFSCTLIDRDSRSRVELPDEATMFIMKFDSIGPNQRIRMSPFSFEIEVPEYVINQIGIDTVHKILSESKTLELVK